MIGGLAEKKPWMSNVVLIVDTMALHNGTIYVSKKRYYTGTVNHGSGVPKVPDDPVTEALIF